MNKYIVRNKNTEKEYDMIHEAISAADKLSITTKTSVYVYLSANGIEEETPFYSCTWEIS